MSSFSDTDAWALGGDRGFAHWNGRDWRNVPGPDGGGRMEAIAVAGPSDAWAVGRRGAPPAGKNFITQIQHWDGASWSIIPSPEFRGRYAALWGVAALAPDDAWAVGCDGTAALVEHWDGGSWSRVTVPVPGPGLHSSLTAISGRSSHDIWAIGTYDNPESAPNTLFALHYDGAAWRAVPMEQIAGHTDGTYAVPWSVVAIGANDAWTVGYTTGTGQRGGTLTEHWDGRRWRFVPSPFDHPSPTTTGSLIKVTARAPNDVWAGGATYTVDDDHPEKSYDVLLLHWNGVRWTQDTTAPTTGSSNTITGLSTTLGGHVIWATNDGHPELLSHP
ncbi:hypothetical protein ACFOY4_24240 [Actinomadura syzygii]|uniref:Carbohydrate-binding protein n=1 Tax=Actinomadura syzygii TaxID=1427538 RepID=A0A5D0ULF7_9ACTN|nr:hypothetical protein [Actinomadura syzygii]TYC18462.1 hypothetical protein FXF65_01485 [Actinomadura syzygii]